MNKFKYAGFDKIQEKARRLSNIGVLRSYAIGVDTGTISFHTKGNGFMHTISREEFMNNLRAFVPKKIGK